MSGFSAEWLALRADADARARSRDVADAVQQHFSTSDTLPFSVCDLGSGTGAAVDAFHSLLPRPQRWLLVDSSDELLAIARDRFELLDDLTIETRTADLAAEPAPWDTPTALVMAHALFDLAAPGWLRQFVKALSDDGLPLLTALTYDGRLSVAPVHPMDRAMNFAFNRHQQTDKGFGPAAGPLAVDVLMQALTSHGYHIVHGDSAWRLDGADDRELIVELLKGWANAVTELELFPDAVVREWRTFRLGETTSMLVGHVDVFAVPSAKLD